VAEEKNVWRDLVYLLAIRYHHITTDDVVLKALPVRFQQHPAVRQAELVSLIKDFDQLQTSVQSWHYAGMKRTINMMGLKRWRSSTASERRKVFEAIWAQDPLENGQRVVRARQASGADWHHLVRGLGNPSKVVKLS